jgi:hypothetical protein
MSPAAITMSFCEVMHVSQYFLRRVTDNAGNPSWLTDSSAMAIVCMRIAG